MKKLFWITLVFAACNSADKTTDKSTAASANEKKENTDASGCAKMIFFKEGAEIDTKTYDGNGKEVSTQHSKIISVKEEGGMTVATSESVDTVVKKEPFWVNYKCDGSKIYVDIASIMNNAAKEKGGQFEASPVEYPIDVKEGETLPDANGEMKIAAKGKTMTVKYHFKDRKVEAKEEVTTPAGTFSCFKVSNTVESEMEMPGMTEQMQKVMETMKDKVKMSSVTWFAPSFGVVKSETYINGKMQTRNEVVGYKD